MENAIAQAGRAARREVPGFPVILEGGSVREGMRRIGAGMGTFQISVAVDGARLTKTVRTG